MAIPKWISDIVGNVPQVATKGYQVPNGPSVNFDDPLYAELYSKYITGQLNETDATAVDEIEFLRDVANQATAKLISAMHNKLSADEKKKTPSETPKMETPDRNENAPSKGKSKEALPEPSSSQWREVRWNERLEVFQAITTERKVNNFATEEEAINSLHNS